MVFVENTGNFRDFICVPGHQKNLLYMDGFRLLH